MSKPTKVGTLSASIHFHVPSGHALTKKKIGAKAKVIVHGTVHSLSHYPEEKHTSVGMSNIQVHSLGADSDNDGDMYCPKCGDRGAGPWCPECGSKMVKSAKELMG